MGLLDRVKANLQETATLAKEGIEDLQTKRELGQVYGELGRKAFDLMEAGELSHPALQELATRVRTLKAELEAETAAASAPAPPSDQPRS